MLKSSHALPASAFAEGLWAKELTQAMKLPASSALLWPIAPWAASSLSCHRLAWQLHLHRWLSSTFRLHFTQAGSILMDQPRQQCR